MDAKEQSQKWHEQSEPVFAQIARWRKDHPHATMAEIERAVDEQMKQLRAQVLQKEQASSLKLGKGHLYYRSSNDDDPCAPQKSIL
jgi:hypothetical protein